MMLEIIYIILLCSLPVKLYKMFQSEQLFVLISGTIIIFLLLPTLAAGSSANCPEGPLCSDGLGTMDANLDSAIAATSPSATHLYFESKSIQTIPPNTLSARPAVTYLRMFNNQINQTFCLSFAGINSVVDILLGNISNQFKYF